MNRTLLPFIVLGLMGLFLSSLLWAKQLGGPLVVYGKDDRILSSLSKNELYLKLSRSTAAQIDPFDLVWNDELMAFLPEGRQLSDSKNLCEKTPFGEMLTVSRCSGFLIEDDLLATAGHCVREDFDCASYHWVFGYSNTKEGTLRPIHKNDIYSCAEIVKQEFDRKKKIDYAIIRLDRKVVGRTPLEFRRKGRVSDETSLVMIGHPSGLPTMITDNGKIRSNSEENYFLATLDSFIGNSGSAVFDAKTGLVEGILVRGEEDYVFEEGEEEEKGAESCNRIKVCKEDECRGEGVTRINSIKGINELIPSKVDKISINTSSWMKRFNMF